MPSPIIMQSLTYAGLTSNALLAGVCMICGEWDKVPEEFINLAAWVGNYLYHKKIGTW